MNLTGGILGIASTIYGLGIFFLIESATQREFGDLATIGIIFGSAIGILFGHLKLIERIFGK